MFLGCQNADCVGNGTESLDEKLNKPVYCLHCTVMVTHPVILEDVSNKENVEIEQKGPVNGSLQDSI